MGDINTVEQEQQRTISRAAELAESGNDRIVALVSSAKTLTIDTEEELEASGGLLREVKERKVELTELRLSITRPMDEAKKRVMGLFKPAIERLEGAERVIKNAVLGYTLEQERIQREEQDRIDQEAERERQRLLNLAEKRREEEKPERAETFQQRAEEVEAPVVEAAKVPSGAVHVRTTWRAEVTDLEALVAACAAGQVPLEVLEPNMPMLNKMAREKREYLKIPGVDAVSERDVAARR